MNKLFLLMSSLILIGTSVKAQEDLTSKGKNSPAVLPMKIKAEEQKTPATKVGSYSNVPSNRNYNIKEEDQSLLQEIFSLEDERNIIEKNSSLSSSDRAQQIQENTKQYNEKRNELMNYIESKGLKNVTSQEQGFYLYCLKKDNRMDDYNNGVELIKN